MPDSALHAPPPSRPYWPALDGLRGVAILLVMARHLDVLPAGWVGVDVFFVLSGFLITGVLLAARGAPDYYARFYVRRARRILPLALLTLAAVAALDPTFRRLAPWYACYAANLPVAALGWAGSTPATSHFWSLAVEEQFYLAWPLVVAVVPPRRLPGACLALVAASVAVRTALVAVGHAPPEAAYVLTPARLDGFALGSALAVAWRGRHGGDDPEVAWWARASARLRWLSTGRAAPLALGAGVVLSVTAVGGDPYGAVVQTAGYLGLALAGAAVLVATLNAPPTAPLARWLGAPWLTAVGRRSYGLYLLHLPIIAGLGALGVAGRRGSLSFTATALGASFAAAWASWRWVEAPFLRRNRALPTKIPGATSRGEATGSARP